MKKTVLLVSREDASEEVRQALARNGFRVIAVSSTRAARSACGRAAVDVIVINVDDAIDHACAERDQHILASVAPLIVIALPTDASDFPAATGVFSAPMEEKKIVRYVRRLTTLAPSLRSALVDRALADSFRARVSSAAVAARVSRKRRAS